MAQTSFKVAQAIRETSRNIQGSINYQWGHMGSCNCGFLAQVVTKLSREEIHQKAMQGCGDWSEQLDDYCPASGLPMDELISVLLNAGFTLQDLHHLERLSDPKVIQGLSPENRSLRHNVKSDVLQYLNAWANWIEDKMISTIPAPEPGDDLWVNHPEILSLGNVS